jgi:polysaccharide deacetylase family protein (PEP-CTERM system associated)
MRNLLSIDLEDWFCVSNFDDLLGREVWDACELRVVHSTRRLLELLDRRGVQATFFVLGWVAERAPELIREVAAAGHEIACHGYHHHRLGYLDPARLDADLGKAMPLLRELSGAPIEGYRAPSFSLTKQTMWAVPVLERHGLRWDSSVFPFGGHPEYGIADAPLEPYTIGDRLLELPMSVVEFGGRRLPCTGGGYFRLYPYILSRWFLNAINRSNKPFVFYLHPWEVDPGQPQVDVTGFSKFRHYNNLDRCFSRLEKLLTHFRFDSMKVVLQDLDLLQSELVEVKEC